MDTDTTMSRFAHQQGFDAFARGDYDIMIGTQMVAKGLNFPRVTLVGVLNADQSLYTDDFRGFERTFSLLTQVVGRSGRADLPGRAFVQTFSSEHRIFPLAASQDYRAFFAEEIEFRRQGLYPPFFDIVCVLFCGAQEEPQICLCGCSARHRAIPTVWPGATGCMS
jgi:primosomal protein N' (replication factor Y)